MVQVYLKLRGVQLAISSHSTHLRATEKQAKENSNKLTNIFNWKLLLKEVSGESLKFLTHWLENESPLKFLQNWTENTFYWQFLAGLGMIEVVF